MKASYHESAVPAVEGKAVFTGDMDMEVLEVFLYKSPHPKARIVSADTSLAAAQEGVEAVISYVDIPGENRTGPVIEDEVCLAEDRVFYAGQPVFLVVAKSLDIAKRAAALIRVEYEVDPNPVVSLDQAIEEGALMTAPKSIQRGEPEQAFSASDYIVEDEFQSGGQEHWYLETQVAVAVPGEQNEMKLYSATQHPAGVQAAVAKVLGIRQNEVEVEVRRLGGAFGGKETQATLFAVYAALAAKITGKPARVRLEREEDQRITGKRHPVISYYKVGFDKNGKILALDVEMNLDGGWSLDLSGAILERALFHIDNAYFIPHLQVTGLIYRTNKPSNTAFRGFGGPQAILLIENIIDRIARQLKIDPFTVRKRNFYTEKNNVTHYGQRLDNIRLPLLEEEILQKSDYFNRRKAIRLYNQNASVWKKGIALSPVKFGISFTTAFLNQAGALVNVYRDGTVIVHHGGVEMGQGVHTKIRRIVALELGIDEASVKVFSTHTSIVPNASATAASTGTDLNGMAVKNAVEKIKQGLATVFCNYTGESDNKELPEFKDGLVFFPENKEKSLSFAALADRAYLSQVSLSATGFYLTPELFFDKKAGKGKPFHYFACGMAVSEVKVNTFTGEVELVRVDIVHDAGKSIHVAIDKGQVEGGFVQGMGWLVNEELVYDDNGKLLSDSPSTYKIPAFSGVPENFHVSLLENAPNPNTIRQSKAVGEPPFMLAVSVWLAIKDAVSAVDGYENEPPLLAPATPHAVLEACERLKGDCLSC